MRGRVAASSLWRHRDFMLIWSGQTVSLLGSQVTFIAMPLLAIGLQASTFQVSLLTTFSTLPWLLVSLPAGVIVDRHRKRHVMLCADLVRGILVSSVPVAGYLHVLTLWQLYVVAMASGTCSVFFSAAYLSFPATLLEREQLVAANGMLSTANSVAGVAGPNMTGFLLGILGAARVVAIDGFSYLVSALSLFLVRHREAAPAPAPAAERGFRQELFGGLRVIVGDRVLGCITFSNSLGNFLLTAINSIWVLYAIRERGWSEQALGVVLGVSAIGGVIGSFLGGPLIKRYGLSRVLLYSQLPFFPGEVVGGLAPSGRYGQLAVATGFSVTLASAIVYNIAQRSYRITACEPRLLGRLNASVSWLQWGTRPFAALAGGIAGTSLGLRPTIVCFALLLALCPLSLWISPLRKEYRSAPRAEERELSPL